MKLVRPGPEHLPSYIDALKRDWSHDNSQGADGARKEARKELVVIHRDPEAYLESLVDLGAKGPPIPLPDGTTTPRLPGFRHWLWDGEFCGAISFRWRPGTTELPPTCLGHIGYSVVPWKRRRGYATEALRQWLPIVREVSGLPFVDLTTYPQNTASRRVILANGGVLVEEFNLPGFSGGRALRFRITF